MWWLIAILAAVALPAIWLGATHLLIAVAVASAAVALWILLRPRAGVPDRSPGTAATVPGLEATEPHFVLDASGAVFVPASPGRWLLVLLAVADEDALRDAAADGFRGTLGGGTVEAVVVLNQGEEGWLGASELARRVGVKAADVYALDPDRAIDRRSGPLAGPAMTPKALPPSLALGELSLSRRGALADALQLDWRTGVAMRRVVIGYRVPFDALLHPPVHYFMGSLAKAALDGEPTRWQTLVLWREVVLLEHLPGPSSLWAGELLSMTGVRVVTFGRPADPERELLVGVLTDDRELVAQILARVGVEVVVSAVEALVTDGRIDAARRLADQALQGRPDVTEFLYQRAVVAAAAGQPEDAAARFRQVTERAPQYAPAWSKLAELAAAGGDLEAAHEHAHRALSLAPEDKVAVRAAVQVHQQRGQIGPARRILSEHGRALRITERLSLEASLVTQARELDGEAPPPAADWEPLQTQARAAIAAADHAGAIPLLEQALALAPEQGSLAVELGVCLTHLGRDEDAVTCYTDALGRLPADRPLRMGRADALRRLGRLDEALADYRVVVDLAPEWAAGVAALVAALHAAGDADGAREALEGLEALDGDAAEVAALRALVGAPVDASPASG